MNVPPVDNIVLNCDTCKKRLIWPIKGWTVNIVGVLQIKCQGCGQIISFPNQAVWGLKEKADIENAAARLLFGVDTSGTKTEQEPPLNKPE